MWFLVFEIDKKVRGSLYYGRDVFLRTVIKVDGENDVSADTSITVDFGTKNSPKFGLHHLLKLDAKTTLTQKGEKMDEKFLNFEGVLSRAFNNLNVQLQTSCPDFRDVRLSANFGGNKFETEFVKNEGRISAFANLEKQGSTKFVLQSKLESSFHSFESIDLTGKIDVGDSPKVFEVSGKSADGVYNVEIKSMMEWNSKGSIKLTAVIPIVGLNEKDLQVILNILIIKYYSIIILFIQ